MPVPKHLMYETLAEYYDLVYSWKDYASESGRIRELISDYKLTAGNDLLDVACGTGNHVAYLLSDFRVAGVDKSSEMLRMAKKKLPGIALSKGDMKSFRLKRKFDIITCLFSSISYLRGYDELEKTLRNFSNHLLPGGVAIIEPFVQKEKFWHKHIHVLNVEDEKVKITRMTYGIISGEKGILDFHFLIGTSKGIRVLRDRQEVFLFNQKKFLSVMHNCGFEPVFLENGLMENRGLYIGVKTEK